MVDYLKIFLIALVVIAGLFLVYYIVTIILDLLRIKKAISYSFYNNIKCGQELCEADIETLSLPTNINMKDWQLDVVRYCANLVYALEKSVKDDIPLVFQPDVTLVKELHEDSTEPLIGAILTSNDDSNTLWVVFRGTYSSDEWKKDLELQQEGLSLANSSKQTKQNFLSNEAGEQPNLHKGFVDVYQTIRYQLLDTISMYNHQRIVITGHSLGAALATIAGIDLYQRGYNNIVFNFASPRVGDKIFADLVDKSIKLYRVVNTADIVPTLPLASQPNYVDPENPLLYSHCGEMVSFENNWFSGINNHLMPSYIEGINSMLKS